MLRPKSDIKSLRRCPNCLEHIKGWYDHWGDDDDSPFTCTYNSLISGQPSREEVSYVMNMHRAFDRAISDVETRQTWGDFIDRYIAEEEAANPSLKWWETALAYGVLLPIYYVVGLYAKLDAHLRKQGI